MIDQCLYKTEYCAAKGLYLTEEPTWAEPVDLLMLSLSGALFTMGYKMRYSVLSNDSKKRAITD